MPPSASTRCPEQLTIEITERMLLADAPLVAQVCATLVQIGVGLSLDDFGTGHASLQQLRQLPLSEVKVDQSYVRGIVDNPADRAIVTSVHELAQTLGVEVVAEGVEDQRTADCLATSTARSARVTTRQAHDRRRPGPVAGFPLAAGHAHGAPRGKLSRGPRAWCAARQTQPRATRMVRRAANSAS